MTDTNWSRRGLLAGTFGLGLGLIAPPLRSGDVPTAADSETPSDTFPRQATETVLEVVTRAHFDLERIRELVTERPALARATWDWGFGDWESALGAASHMGRRDIAELLIDHGARPNLFTAAMMGDLAVVRGQVESRPGIQVLRGPHGLTLLHHARAGGEAAGSVVEYLERLGGADPALPTVELPDETTELYPGTYRFGEAPDERLEVTLDDDVLRIARPPAAPRTLHPLGDHSFFPAGAEAVRIRFEIADGPARAVAVHDPGLLARAVRVR